jgi:hypothetical protein
MDRASVQDQVDRILHSSTFAGKSQLAKLLEALFDRMDSQSTLKPDCVIRELWPDETKTKRSADVATEMNRLRKALECYYVEEGAADPIIVSLPNRSVTIAGSAKEKRWIVAEPRGAAQPASVQPTTLTSPRRWLKIIAGAAGVAVLAAVAYFVFRRLTVVDQPQSARLDGSTLIVVNAKGEELWRKSFPDGLSTEYYNQGVATRMWIGDLNGDGRSEVLFLHHPAGNIMSHSTTLICYSDRGSEKWRWHPGKELAELEGNPATFRTVGLAVLKAKPGERRRIVLSSTHMPLYPDQIAVIDADSKTISEYWHSGHLYSLTVADLDGDGREEILAAGISNGYRQATLVVLDPDRVFGASSEAARPEIQLHNMGDAKERLRLLFPRSDMNKTLSVYNQNEGIIVEHGRTRLAVRECWQLPGCLIWYEFDKDFHLVSVEPDDQFRAAHAEFYLKLKENHPFSKEEESEFQAVRCLVGCRTAFVPIDIH